jgi:hypothetical protein
MEERALVATDERRAFYENARMGILAILPKARRMTRRRSTGEEARAMQAGCNAVADQFTRLRGGVYEDEAGRASLDRRVTAYHRVVTAEASMQSPPDPPERPFTTREAALCALFALIRRNADIDLNHLRILAELAELPARTRVAIA